MRSHIIYATHDVATHIHIVLAISSLMHMHVNRLVRQIASNGSSTDDTFVIPDVLLRPAACSFCLFSPFFDNAVTHRHALRRGTNRGRERKKCFASDRRLTRHFWVFYDLGAGHFLPRSAKPHSVDEGRLGSRRQCDTTFPCAPQIRRLALDTVSRHVTARNVAP